MTETTTRVEDDDGLTETAAFWAVRLSGQPSDADMAAFEAWIAEDPAHLDAFNAAEEMLGFVSDNAAAPELLAMRSEALDRVHRLQRKRWSGGLSLDRRHMFAAAAACLVAVPVGAWWLTRQPEGEGFRTGVGERRTVTLSDGTRVTLDAMSRVEVRYSRRQRRIELAEGRAYFEVAKDASRPLTVHADHRTVTAIGTAFTVERETGGLLVTLVEGKVAVTDQSSAKPIPMSPQQTLRLRDGAAPVLVAQVDTGRALAWREGQIVFDNVDLASAVARMNAYSRTPLVIEESGGSRLSQLRISGIFTAGDSLRFAEALKAYFGVSVTQSGDAIILRKAA